MSKVLSPEELAELRNNITYLEEHSPLTIDGNPVIAIAPAVMHDLFATIDALTEGRS